MLIKKDVDLLLSSGHTFEEFDGSTVTILGGTGFIGQWIVNALHEYSQTFGFSIQISIVTRDSKKARELFAKKLGAAVKFIEFDFAIASSELGESDFFINGSTPSRKKTGLKNTDAVFASSVNASMSIIRSAVLHKNNPRVVNLSSGIVYGSQALSVAHQLEDSVSIKPDSHSGYLNAKLSTESIFSDATNAGILNSISPRLYAFAGPGIALDEHFAVGNFLRDGLRGEQIKITGNPETVRSYMYPTDLTVWILAALINPKNQNVNIGSEFPIKMFELAHLISDMTSKLGVRTPYENQVASNYVPSTTAFRKTYGVSESVTLETGLLHWIEWLSTSKRF